MLRHNDGDGAHACDFGGGLQVGRRGHEPDGLAQAGLCFAIHGGHYDFTLQKGRKKWEKLVLELYCVH